MFAVQEATVDPPPARLLDSQPAIEQHLGATSGTLIHEAVRPVLIERGGRASLGCLGRGQAEGPADSREDEAVFPAPAGRQVLVGERGMLTGTRFQEQRQEGGLEWILALGRPPWASPDGLWRSR